MSNAFLYIKHVSSSRPRFRPLLIYALYFIVYTRLYLILSITVIIIIIIVIMFNFNNF